jgi:hypothetical protein
MDFLFPRARAERGRLSPFSKLLNMYVNAKIIPVQSIPGMEEGGGIKGV